MHKSQQLTFWKSPGTSFGGDLYLGRRKCARPLATKRPLHIVLRSQRARGKWNFLLQRRKVEQVVGTTAQRFGLRVYGQQNVGNHLHLLVQGKTRRQLQNFLRVLPQAIAFLITGTRKGRPIGRFWDRLAFTRTIEWGNDWRRLHNYLEKNRFEAWGMPRDVVDTWMEMNGG